MKKARIATYLANVVEHFDMSLYGFLVPILAPLFFPQSDPLIALIEGYAILLIGFITRPLGAWYFSKKADTKGPSKVLVTTITGMTISTFFFTFLQPYEFWGINGAIALCLLRGVQIFFGAGETSVAGLYILENSPEDEQHAITAKYLSGQMLGILIASTAASLLFYCDTPSLYWKWPFYGSLIAGLVCCWLRRTSRESAYCRKNFSDQKMNWRAILRLVPITGFSYILYAAPFVFFNSFVNFVSKIEVKDLMAANTGLMVYDIFLLTILGPFLSKANSKKILLNTALAALVLTPTIFWWLPHVEFLGSILARLILVTLGVIFCIPLSRWYMEEIPAHNRFSTTALGYAIGSETLGRSFPAIGLGLWHITQSAVVPGLYIAFIGLLAFLAIRLKKA